VHHDGSRPALVDAPGCENLNLNPNFVHAQGLDYCADTLVGNEMVRGISGGQKKRVTTGSPGVTTSC